MADPHRAEIAKLEALYAANPDGRIFTHLAEAYRKAGDLERARQTVEEGLSRHSDYPSAHVVRGRVLWDLGEVEAAEHAFRRVLELDAENRVALRGLGDLAREAGRPAEALEHYRALLLLDPGDSEVQELARTVEEQVGAIGGMFGEDQGPAPLQVEPTVTDAPEPAAGPEGMGGLEGLEPTTMPGADDAPAGLDIDPAELGVEPVGGADANTADLAMDVTDLPMDVTGHEVDTTGLDLDTTGLELDTTGLELDTAGLELDTTGLELDTAGSELDGGGLELEVEGLETDAVDFGSGAEGIDLDTGIGSDLEVAQIDPGAIELDSVLGSDDGDGGEIDLDRPVVTETMADLYARQGLHERAADVYRELLRGRPGDARLEAKLREAEMQAAGGVDVPGDDIVESDAPFVPLGGGEADGASPDETSAPEAAGDDVPVGGLDTAWLPADEADAPTPIEDLADAVIELPEIAAGDPEPWAGDAEPLAGDTEPLAGDTEPLADEVAPAMEVDAGIELEPVLEAVPGASDIGGGSGVDGEAPVAGELSEAGGWSGEAGVMGPTIGEYLRALLVFRRPAEAGPGPETGGVEPRSGAAPAADSDTLVLDESAIVEETPYEPDEYDRLFDTAGSGSGGAADEPAAPAPAWDAGQPDGATSKGSTGGGDGAGDDDDEDLEMFRAWLQNLKR